jgi:hypothetical protein
MERAILDIATVMPRFESNVLHIPPSLRFFTAGADPDELFRQAFRFLLAPFHAFVSMPLLDLVLGRKDSQLGSRRLLCDGTWYVKFLVTFWVSVLIVSLLHGNCPKVERADLDHRAATFSDAMQLYT